MLFPIQRHCDFFAGERYSGRATWRVDRNWISLQSTLKSAHEICTTRRTIRTWSNIGTTYISTSYGRVTTSLVAIWNTTSKTTRYSSNFRQFAQNKFNQKGIEAQNITISILVSPIIYQEIGIWYHPRLELNQIRRSVFLVFGEFSITKEAFSCAMTWWRKIRQTRYHSNNKSLCDKLIRKEYFQLSNRTLVYYVWTKQHNKYSTCIVYKKVVWDNIP